eukprot:scaffold11223_cov57-Attheya_sp.AAC.5
MTGSCFSRLSLSLSLALNRLDAAVGYLVPCLVGVLCLVPAREAGGEPWNATALPRLVNFTSKPRGRLPLVASPSTTVCALRKPGKGKDYAEPNNWRGICLESSRNPREDSEFHYFHETPRSLKRNRLVKAFDTVDHSLVFKILKKYGIPENLIKVIAKMYKDSTVIFKSGQEMREIPYEIGVKQGEDNMAPVLFIYLMNAIVETLSEKWTFKKLEYKWFPTSKNGNKRGRLMGQSPKAIRTKLIFFTFYTWMTVRNAIQ